VGHFAEGHGEHYVSLVPPLHGNDITCLLSNSVASNISRFLPVKVTEIHIDDTEAVVGDDKNENVLENHDGFTKPTASAVTVTSQTQPERVPLISS